jgi:hypothetical protein
MEALFTRKKFATTEGTTRPLLLVKGNLRDVF